MRAQVNLESLELCTQKSLHTQEEVGTAPFLRGEGNDIRLHSIDEVSNGVVSVVEL